MSIAGNTPFYIAAHKRDDGLIDYVLMNPRGWGADEVRHVSPLGARDEEQVRGRVQELVPPWQDSIAFHYVNEEALRRIAAGERRHIAR